MAELTANIFRDTFGGSWSGIITRNGELKRTGGFQLAGTQWKIFISGDRDRIDGPPGGGVLDDTRQVAISGWRPDIQTLNPYMAQ